jgi:hypothetical protein
MNENWVMPGIGLLLIVCGFVAKGVRGAMPGASPGYPPPLRFRLIMICFGLLMFVLGMYRLIYS